MEGRFCWNCLLEYQCDWKPANGKNCCPGWKEEKEISEDKKEMNDNLLRNNKVKVSGELVSPFEFSHVAHGEKFYKGFLSVKRMSETVDVIPVMASERLLDMSTDHIGSYMDVVGNYRSRNMMGEDEKTHLVCYVFARSVKILDKEPSPYRSNLVEMNGYICKEPQFRVTPLGREIVDLLIAVNRPFGTTDYVPCIAWGRNARWASEFPVGTHLHFKGRFQSRIYKKHITDHDYEEHTAYELSISQLEVKQ